MSIKPNFPTVLANKFITIQTFHPSKICFILLCYWHPNLLFFSAIVESSITHSVNITSLLLLYIFLFVCASLHSHACIVVLHKHYHSYFSFWFEIDTISKTMEAKEALLTFIRNECSLAQLQWSWFGWVFPFICNCMIQQCNFQSNLQFEPLFFHRIFSQPRSCPHLCCEQIFTKIWMTQSANSRK